MFDFLKGVGQQLRGELLEVYWILLVPFVVFLVVLEVVKGDGANLKELLRRLIMSVILVMTFDWAIEAIATLGDAVTSRIDGLNKLSEVLAHLGPGNLSSGSMFSLRETVIYVFSLAAYIVAYVGFFTATALTHFVWTLLYVCSPLMILAYLSAKTEHVTMSLYKGLVQVVLWKILYSILGVLLLKLAMQAQENSAATGLDDYLLALIVNLCIGVSMLFIPLATKSLINDGLNSLASSLALAPAIAAAGTVKLAAARMASKVAGGAKDLASFAGKPLTNPISGRYQLMKERLEPKWNNFKKDYSQVGLPRELKERQQAKEAKNSQNKNQRGIR